MSEQPVKQGVRFQMAEMTCEEGGKFLRQIAETTSVASHNWDNFQEIAVSFLKSAMEAGRAFGKADLSNHHNALTCPYCNPSGYVLAYKGTPSEWRVKPEDVSASLPARARETVIADAATRLRAWIREHRPVGGGCRILSADCTCPLCDVDRLHDWALTSSSSGWQPKEEK